MANLTITIDDDLLKRARIRALEHGTSVNAIVREQLERYAGSAASARAAEAFLSIARERPGSSGGSGRSWTREELYADRLGSDG